MLACIAVNLPIANNLPRTPRIRAHASAFLVSLWLLGEVASHAADLPAPFVFDLPFAANQATPFWLGHPETPPANFAVLNLPILTPDPDASLLVTVYFQEKDGGFLRIAWRGTQGAQLLSDNFYEGIGMRNQRSLLITPDTLIGDGILTLQCSDLSLGIRRIRMEWLENRASLVSPEVLDAVVVPARGPVQTAHELAGLPHLVEAGAWEGQVVTVPLADVPQRIEQGVEFSVDLDKTPVAARIALKEAGLPLGRHLVVWINQKLAGTVTPSLPDLLDDGFIAGKGGQSRLYRLARWLILSACGLP